MNDQDRRYIIALGKVCVDEYYEANSWPNIGEKKLVKPMKKMIGGMIANAACVLSGYKVKTYLLDLLNDSTTTTEIIEDLNKYNVDTSLLLYDSSIADSKCIIFLVGGERVIFVVDDKRPGIRLNKEQLKMLAGAEYIYTTIPDLKELEQPFELISQ
ncbi:MAG TPA: carbohydrate kinase family protein, partial [Clostridiales bacterium]|nr:carbohydrate kinase family protein [Clostridiales bacterium]